MNALPKREGCSCATFLAYRRTQSEFAAYKKERDRLWFTYERFDIMPRWPCCYVVYRDGELVYVGQTENIVSRIRQHRAKKPYWFRDGKKLVIKVKLSRRYGQWAMDELRLIRKLRPCENLYLVDSREEFMML